MYKSDLAALIGVILAVIAGSFTGFGSECAEIRDNVVRFHIMANSDSAEDQAVKYAVRDAIQARSAEIFGSAADVETAEAEISARLSLIEEIAGETVAGAGCGYPVKAELVNMYFATRQYEDVTVPAGRYDAVRLTLGGGGGQNWWCVMFPPMCVPAAVEKEVLPIERQITELGSNPRYKPKFAVVEMVESVKEALSGKAETANP